MLVSCMNSELYCGKRLHLVLNELGIFTAFFAYLKNLFISWEKAFLLCLDFMSYVYF